MTAMGTAVAAADPAGVALRIVPGLEVTAPGRRYEPEPARVVVRQTEANPGGSTSVRNTRPEDLEWKEQGYFQRNRDLGQVFTAPRDFRLEAIVLRTGPSDAAVLEDAPGARVFVQFFAVEGEPCIDDNGTPPGSAARHGFSKNHRCDDRLAGVTCRPLGVVTGGVFPALSPTRRRNGEPSGDDTGRMTCLRWRLAPGARPAFEKGRRYAFLVGFETPGRHRGFTLANANAAGVDAPPALADRHDRYPGGWGLRREGDGTLPPTMLPGAGPPENEIARARLRRESLFADGAARYRLAPTTDGFPDVDTYRDLDFCLEAEEGDVRR